MTPEARDEATLRAAPATFLDKKSKAPSLLEALRDPPQYPLSKALTVDDARAILDAWYRGHPSFIRFEDARKMSVGKLIGWTFYYVDDPKYGVVRWAVKNKEIQLQIKKQGRWANAVMGGALLLIEAALKRLEAIAQRRKDDVLASAVAGWMTTRDVASERGASKRDQKELLAALRRLAMHQALANNPKEALEYGGLHHAQKNEFPYSEPRLRALVSKFNYDTDLIREALAKKHFRLADVPKTTSVYDLDHPPAPLATGDRMQIEQVAFGSSVVVAHGPGAADAVIVDVVLPMGVVHPRDASVRETRGYASDSMLDALTRVLRAYGFAYLVLPEDLVGREGLIERLRARGYAGFDATHFAIPGARKNPRRGARR